MTPPVWVVDHRPARRVGLTGEPLADAVRAAGGEVVETVFDPAAADVPGDLLAVFETGRPVVLRGSVGFAAWAHNRFPGLRPGVFPSDRLRPSAYLPAYGGDLALNAGAVLVPAGAFDARRPELQAALGPRLFVKPADGGKALSGVVVEPGHTLAQAHFAAHRRWDEPPPDARLLVAQATGLRAEWRFVVAGGAVAARSLYRLGTTLTFAPAAPDGAETIARTVAAHPYQPAPVFVADVVETDGGAFRLLELNTFGTAGLYACDLPAVVAAVGAVAGA